jgi:cholest-4-en-3-one 26-monooxygenase
MSVTTTSGDLQDLARVDQPGFYDVRNAPLLARLRREAPVFHTRNLLAGTMWALTQHPSQMRTLAADPSLVKQTVEEVLRWITPVPGFMRNAKQDIELRGQKINQGQYVYLLYFAANRDEECWTNPDTFDITRPPEPAVLSFGFGQHACIGAAVARLEARVFLEEMLARFSGVSLAGEAKRVGSPLQHGWHELPVAFER